MLRILICLTVKEIAVKYLNILSVVYKWTLDSWPTNIYVRICTNTGTKRDTLLTTTARSEVHNQLYNVNASLDDGSLNKGPSPNNWKAGSSNCSNNLEKNTFNLRKSGSIYRKPLGPTMFLILLSIIICQADQIESDSCSEGLFLNNGVCAQCTPNCQRCNQLDTCDLCTPGFYIRNDKCSKCTLGCTNCLSFKECLSCTEEYVLTNGGCFNCSAICDDCSEPGICKVCKSGYYATSNNGCNPCRANCSMCSDETHCQSCINGYYLQTSDCIECPEGCYGKQCSRDNGECSNGCVVGFYTQFCNISCSEGCRDKTCYKSNGICTNGCKEGYYGSSCQPCPEVCINRTCSASDGRCIHGCANGYYKDNIKGQCNKCPDNCKHCVHWFSCTSCIEGFFGQNCSSTCRYCMPGGCALDGICIHGCRDGFYRDQTRCWHCPDNCSKCNSTGYCTECKSGYFGNRCERKCPLNCLACNYVDNEQTGACINCSHHTFGEFCEFSCSANCLMTSNAVSSCFQENGSCHHGCVGGFTGHNCTEEIPKSHQRPMVPAIIGSALGGALLVAALCSLVLLARWRLKQKPKSNIGVDTDVPCTMQNAMPNSSVGNDETIISLGKQSDAAGHVYAVVLEKCHLNQKRTNIDIDQCIADDNVYDVSTTEWKQSSSQRHPKAEAVPPGVETYTHISHVNKTRPDGQHKDEEMLYDHVAHDFGRQGNEGTYDVARIFQGNRQYKGTEMTMASSRQYYGDGSHDCEDTYSHINHQLTRGNADTIYNTARDLTLPQNMEHAKSDWTPKSVGKREQE